MQLHQVFLHNNQSFFLSKKDHFWVVASGIVDIYYVQTDEQGQQTSGRNYLYTAEKGDILFSLNQGEQDYADFSLIAVSADSKLIEINKSYVRNLNKTQLTTKMNRWVTAMSKSLFPDKKPKNFKCLNGESEVHLRRGEIGYPTKGLLWGALDQGKLSIFGQLGTLTAQESSKNVLVPISQELWIRALEHKTSLRLFETKVVVEDDIALMLSIHHLLGYFYEEIKKIHTEKVEAEVQYIAEKAEQDESSINGGITRLKSVFFSKKNSPIIHSSKSKSPLFKACQIIGAKVGFDFKEPKYIRDYEDNLTGQLSTIAQVSKVRVRKVILRGEWWKTENGHLLAFLEEDKQPVALIQKSSKSYELHDPKTGAVTIISDEIAQTLDPIAYMFLYAFDQPMTSIQKVWSFTIKGLKLDLLYIILAALAGSLIGLLTPILSGIIFDDVIPHADRSFLYEIFGILLMIGFVKALLNLIRGILLLRLETKSNIGLQAGLIDHLLRLPVTFFRKYASGDLTMRALGINAIRQIVSNTILTAVLSGAFSIVNLFLLFYYDSYLAWVGIGLSVFAVVVISLLGFLKLKYDRQISDDQGELQGFLFEFLSGISKIRISGSEKRVFGLWAEKFAEYKSLGFKSGNYQNFVEVFMGAYPLMTKIFFFSFIYFTLMNTTGQNSSLISVGVFMAFISAFSQFLNDCLNMSFSLVSSLNVVPIYERLKPILEEEPESAGESADPGELEGELEFNAVSFRYDKDQPLVLKDISFKIKPGEMVAFVGPSGSGKSTVLRLLLGFEEPEVGSIYYDGQEFHSLNRELVRKQVGVVLQHGALMAGSIYKNIVGNSELTLEDAERAAALAGLKEDIAHMPMGMHTVVSEGGSTFSGGQRQRLMIARAIVHKPRIIYMDEATSALDNRTQDIVSESLDQLQATRIVIAHRLSTIINADRIYVMDKGQIVEHGSYDELMEKEGLFASLAKRQIA